MLEIWKHIIYVPPVDDLNDLAFISNGNRYSFDNAKLAVDGSLINKQINVDDGSVFFDRKGNCSINCLFVFDSNCNIRSMFINKPGSCNDKRVFRESSFGQNIDTLLPEGYYCLGDSGYELTNKVLTPYGKISLMNDTGGIKLFYNGIQSSARMVAERGIGLLKQRCKPLMKGLNLSKATESAKFIAASAILHQIFLNIEGKCFYDDEEGNEEEEEEAEGFLQSLESGLPAINRDAIARKMYSKYTIFYNVFIISFWNKSYLIILLI